jgi:hypothetical protein
MWEVGLPSSPVEFSSLHHSHKLPRSWLLGMRPCSHQRLSGLPGLLFTVLGRIPFPQCAPPSFLHVLFVLIAYYSVSLFSWGGGQSVQGAMLLVSPFNVKWRFSVLAGDVEGSKLCLFSVIMPAKCVSGISPRFHYRRHAFCFLSLTDILEFSLRHFLDGSVSCYL